MENWRLVDSRLRFLRETFDNSFWQKIGPHLGFPFSKGFNSLDFCTLQRIHPQNNGVCYIDPLNGLVFHFNKKGKLIERYYSSEFFDTRFVEKTITIRINGYEQILSKAENSLEVLSGDIFDYANNHPSEKPEFIQEVNKTYLDEADALRYFKARCYGYGADVICKFKHESFNSLDGVEEKISGSLYKLKRS